MKHLILLLLVTSSIITIEPERFGGDDTWLEIADEKATYSFFTDEGRLYIYYKYDESFPVIMLSTWLLRDAWHAQYVCNVSFVPGPGGLNFLSNRGCDRIVHLLTKVIGIPKSKINDVRTNFDLKFLE
jgi:ABC-type thiamine transport system substrate-binding protein